MHYRQTIDYDSNPYRHINREIETRKSFFFTLFCIYLPIFVLTVGLRAVMLLAEMPIITLRLVDDLILFYLYEFSNYTTELAYLLF